MGTDCFMSGNIKNKSIPISPTSPRFSRGDNVRYFFMILFLLIPLHCFAAAQPSDKEHVNIIAAEWMGLPYRQQIKSVKAIVSLNQLEMCHKQILEVVNCMRAIGTSPGREGSKSEDLFIECSSDMGVETPTGKEKEDGPARCTPRQKNQ